MQTLEPLSGAGPRVLFSTSISVEDDKSLKWWTSLPGSSDLAVTPDLKLGDCQIPTACHIQKKKKNLVKQDFS